MVRERRALRLRTVTFPCFVYAERVYQSSRSVRVAVRAPLPAASIALAAAVSLALAGCGGGGGTPAPAGPPTRAAAPTVAPCPGASAPSHVGAWPHPAPADLPQPPSGGHARVAFKNATLT